jgi:hypothetical protein
MGEKPTSAGAVNPGGGKHMSDNQDTQVSESDAELEREIRKSQADAFCQRIRPMLRFLYLCRKRLDTAGYDPECKLYAAVDKAYDAIHSLHIELHYQSVGHGVARPASEE